MTFLNFAPILAAAEVQNPLDQLGVQPAPRNLLGMRATDVLLIIAATLLVGLILLAWAVYFRKPKAERDRTFNSRPYVEERDDGTVRKRKKRKRQRRDHRQRNPTLAEVGGLPPPKGDTAPPPI